MEDDDEEITAATLRIKPRPLPLSALSAFSYVPPRRLDPKEHSYYYRLGKVSRPREGLRVWARGGESEGLWRLGDGRRRGGKGAGGASPAGRGGRGWGGASPPGRR